MSDAVFASWTLASLGCAAFCCFTWGTLYHFAREGAGPPGAWVVSVLSLETFVLFLVRLVRGLVSPAWIPAACLFAVSIGMWAWALRRTRVAPPTLAFAEDTPRRLYEDGPYRWVRHPFYTAYMTCWLATSIGTRGWLGWIAAAAIGCVYWRAARHEECKFERSSLAQDYTEYRSRTGMFAPRLF